MSESESDPSVIIARHVILRDKLQSRVAELEKELRNANRGAENNIHVAQLALKEKAAAETKAERYREALENIYYMDDSPACEIARVALSGGEGLK